MTETKTIIQMPPKMRQTEAPLLVLNGDEEVIVNYRLQGIASLSISFLIKAMLIAGVGSKQTKIVITRK